jgi:hypothetical protein
MKNPTISSLIGGKLIWLISAAYLHNGVTKQKAVDVVEEVTEDDDDLEPEDGDEDEVVEEDEDEAEEEDDRDA